jgi:chromosomal replication initiator protein
LELPADPELTPAWRAIRDELRRVVGETTYDIWLAPLRPKSWDGAVLLIEAPGPTRAWVSKRFARPLERSVHAVLGDNARIVFAGAEAGGDGRSPAPSGSSRQTAAATPGGRGPIDPHRPLTQRYSFDQFIIGDGNRLAHAAALAVAELPGQAYNPLFLHAPPGLGKTHLLHAIGNYVEAYGDGATVRYTTVESFTNHFITSLGTRTTDAFKRMYREADVLLIDDVQFLASKAKTEEEFFHTFNAIYDSGRQLVLTCDRLPRQLAGVEERLRERFESGLVATIKPPDLAMRIAILRKRAALDHLTLSDLSVLELIATRITDNIRALEGALIRIVAHHSLTGRPIDLELTASVLDEITPAVHSDASTSIESVQTTVAAYFELSVDELLSARRTERIAWPRQVAMTLARELTGASLNELGKAFGGRNHATVVHSCKRVGDRIISDSEAAHDVDNLRGQLRRDHNDLHS